MVNSLIIGVSLAAAGVSAAGQPLAPAQDINLPAGANAAEPLKWLGANGPWFSGDNVNGISADVPENCYVDQAAYVSRHGSRFPDQGAYNGWVSLQQKLSAGGYTASGALSFMPNWKTVLTNPSKQIAMESPTGVKEAQDMGYQLRTRYPDLYKDGDDFMVWANNYTRVLQTAQMFVRGFLGWEADSLGSVVSVTSKGFPGGIGDSLAPSDMCPKFADTEGSEQQSAWDKIWIPPVQARLNSLISGNLTLTAGDITSIPYLCGYESQITGRLSPWCDVLTDEELKSYQYSNDMRYFYGIGPGTDLNKKMMTPYLDALMGLFTQGPNITGMKSDGSSFDVPKLLVSFLNDGQLTELVTSSGVFDGQPLLSPTEKDDNRLWIGSRYVTMRGTITFERLNCRALSGSPGGGGNGTMTTTRRGCRHKTAQPTTLSSMARNATMTASASSSSGSAPVSAITGAPAAQKNATYIRIRLNDAVYPVPSCQDGPGRSCMLSDYVKYVADKYAAEGDWLENCAVTTAGAPTKVKGASFYTDLSSSWLKTIKP
ncbi:histidine acid phosphatase [Apiospora rasikravindrae]|uniref:3-phytase n=1 Tax=Apiospora rasikravindrae TaxID=990691 RepID=A0ABR1SJ27_9PEZI